MHTTISGMHYCIPRTRLTNEELSARFGERQVKSIVRMAGIQERRVVSEGETASDLAYWAALRLMRDRNISPSDIDLLVVATQTGDYQLPNTACVLHGRLGLTDRCAAFDMNTGCPSFPYSLSVAHGMIVSGTASKALVINADALTTLIHPMDRGLVPLHGDGAAAAIVEPCAEGEGFIGFYLGADGSGHQHLMVPASGARLRRSAATAEEFVDENGITRTQEHLYMHGPAVYHFSLYKVPEVIQQALERFRLTIDDFDLVVMHQANKTMIDSIYRALSVPEEKRFYFLEQVGNTSAASTPMALAEAWRQGRIRGGTRTLIVSFGVGLSWGVAAIRWPDSLPPAVEGSVEPGEASE